MKKNNKKLLSLIGTVLITSFLLGFLFSACNAPAEFEQPSEQPSFIRLEIASLPDRTLFLVGEQIDLTGLVVKAVDSNGIINEVNGFTYNGFDPAELGFQTITISYNGMNVSFGIKVLAESSVGDFYDVMPNITITVDTSVRHQFVRGFGGMGQVQFRAGNGMPSPHMSIDDVHTLFNPDWGLGLNILRMIMYDDIEDVVAGRERTPPNPLAPSNIHPTQGYYSGGAYNYLDVIRTVNSYGGYVILAPWTAPARYKGPTAYSEPGQGTLVGSQFALVSEFANIAQWMRNYLLWLNEQGAPVFAVSAQNEYNIGVGFEGMRYSHENMNIFVRDHLFSAIQDIPGFGGGRPTSRVWLSPGEPSGGALNISNIVMDDPVTRNRVDFFGRNFYGDMHQRLDRVLDAGIEVWMTEHNDTTGAGRGMPLPVTTWNLVWHLANEIYCSLALNDESAFVWWFAKRFFGLIGDGFSGTTDGAILPRGHVMSHFSRFAANTNRVQVTGEGTFLQDFGNRAGMGTQGTGGNAWTEGTHFTGSEVYSRPLVTGPHHIGEGSTNEGANFNPTTFRSGNNDEAGQNQASTKTMAFESLDGNSISVIIFTPTNNNGSRGQDMGYVRIDLPEGFTANNAFAMRSNANQKAVLESVALNSEGNAAIIRMPRSNIVSLKFSR